MAAIPESDRAFAERLLTNLNGMRRIDPTTGAASFADGNFGESSSLLRDLVGTHPEIPDDEVSRIASEALFAAAAKRVLTVDGYLAELDRLERECLARVPSRFVLLTQISMRGGEGLAGIRSGGAAISFPPSVPKTFLQERESLLTHAMRSLFAERPKDYRWVKVSVMAKSPVAAADKALDELLYVVGLWNLALNRRVGFRWSAGRREQVNQVGIAPVHTLHLPTGRLASETWWYEPDYLAPMSLRSLDDEFAAVAAFTKTMRSRISRLPYRDKAKDWVRFYNRALDDRDWSTSFIRLWQALESCTDPSYKHGKVIERAASLFHDPEYHKWVLRSLRDCRNHLVHAQGSSSSIESKLYMLKRYVETAIVFHASHAGDFVSLDEATEFLDLPTDPAVIHRRLQLLDSAARFREPMPAEDQ